MKNAPIIIQGICYDEKSSYERGPSKAPTLIRERLWSDAYNHYAENGKEVPPDALDDMGDFEIEDYWEIYEITKRHLDDGHKLMTLGGDHSITYPVFKAVSEEWSDIQILHIDAHGDLYDSFEGDRYSHACPFARIMEDQLASTLVQVGIRTLNPHQRDQVDKYNVRVIEMKDFSNAQLPSFKGPVYISLDMDAFDPAFAPGVSHQESGGLTVREVLSIVHNIKAPIIGADIVEYNPDNDVGGITAALSAKMMKEILSLMV